MNILIADDDPISRFVLAAALKKLGHDVVAAENGEEALGLFEQAQFQVVISDMLMPRLDGLQLCQRIRAANRAQYTYIILLTMVNGKSSYVGGMRAGADDFINKPLDEEVLACRLEVAQRILQLQSQVSQLTGLLPICVFCKRVRDDRNYWHQVESYVAEHSQASFTHSYCPQCFQRLRRQIETGAAGPLPL